MRSREGRRKGAKSRKEQDWRATPLDALHNACGAIWCM